MPDNELSHAKDYLGNDDVIAFEIESIGKVSSLKELVEIFLISTMRNDDVKFLAEHGLKHLGDIDLLFKQGRPCEVLKVGAKSWQKEKVRIQVNIEFIPDEPERKKAESTLDDLRQKINEIN